MSKTPETENGKRDSPDFLEGKSKKQAMEEIWKRLQALPVHKRSEVIYYLFGCLASEPDAINDSQYRGIDVYLKKYEEGS